ncbi:junctional cadherin 5-associated protein [Pempheris klunzingeri]|uniref:junctional cadherin 5-associated protein n=1 Tax=Pempheris klunzingeri TaxID=3127111 RepID=UPI0039815704
MYSVEDLLISHGYKLPKHATSSSTPTPAPASSSRQAPSSSPPSYSRHCEILENRPGPRTVNGYEKGPWEPYRKGDGTRPPRAYSGTCPNNNNEPRERSQSRREGESRSQIDIHSLGESLTSDSGFCDGSRGPQSQSKDVSYWRRRGQDFTVLLDYADFREPHGGEHGGYRGTQQARGQDLSADERQRAAQERQRWAAQAHAQAHAQAQVQAHTREREAALHQWRIVTERKCQSLGTDEWHPAVSFCHQLSQSEGERRAQEQQRLHARTPEGMVVQPRTKAKSQSLPRMLQPDSLQYVDISSSGQELYRRVNGHPLSHHDLCRAPRWPENGRPASANQLSITPKPRFTRPPRPPSYEMHQQIRGSCELLSGRDSVIPQARDRTPLPISRMGDPQLDYFAQESGPPGYIPPPSYKRAPVLGGGRRGYGEFTVDYRYRGDVYQQIQVAPDGSHWFTRHPASSWPDPMRERSMSDQRHLYPVYTTQEHPGGRIQYIPFDDPHIHHISSSLGGNSLTDADKIRHIRNELPNVTVSEPASDDSAFLPPPLGSFIAAKLVNDASQTASSNYDNDNDRWHSDLHKEIVDNFPATDQNCNRYSKNQCPLPSPSSAFQAPLTRTSSRQGSSSDQVFSETITQVKKIVPDLGPENNRNTKRRVSETIFCLVSVPVHTPTSINKDLAADQNNNEAIPSLTITNTDIFAVGLKESLNVRSKSVNEMPIKPHYSHFHTKSTSSMRNYKRAPLRKEIIDAWALQASEDKELCYVGSWPGNQYRNQETQTGSPLTVVKSPEAQSPPGGQEPVQSVSDTATDSGVGTDTSSSYGYPMAGHKNLHLSSNSAFSRLSFTPTQPLSIQPSQQDPSSPSKAQDQGDQQQLSPRKSNPRPLESAEQVAFGQFLLKPMNRRPCDAIGELESINKEMEDTISKRPNVSQSIGDLDAVNKKFDQFKSGAHATAGPEPGREAISLPPMHIEKSSNVKVRSKSLASSADLDAMYTEGAFSRTQTNNIPLTTELSLLPNPGPRECCLMPSLLTHNESNCLYRQDITVPKESLLRDVGLTVYTETPGGPGKPMQRSLSVPSPLDHKEHSQSVQLSWESRGALVESGDSPDENSNKELQAEIEAERKTHSDGVPPFRVELNLSVCGTNDSSRSPQKDGLPHITKMAREISSEFESVENERCAVSEPLAYKNESTMADKHLENLLTQEKAITSPAQDLSNLYEVKCAKGIPENESIEQRAARILGIAVPVEALGVAEKQSEIKQDDKDATVAETRQSQGEETEQVIQESEQLKDDSVQGAETEEAKETDLGVDHEELDREQQGTKCSDVEDNKNTETQSLVLDLPEFPPSKLPLSLLIPREKLTLSVCSVEKRGQGGAIESPQPAYSPATSLDRTSCLNERDSVSQIRCFSLKCSEGELDPEEKDGDGEENKAWEETKEETVEQQDREEDKKLEDKGWVENPDEHENARETHDKLGDSEEDFKSEVEANGGMCKREQSQEEKAEEMNVEIALKAENEGSEDVDVEVKTEEQQREMERKIAQDDKEEHLEKGGDEQKTAEVRRSEATQGTKVQKLLKPKQRSMLQKPPLLPKPRSVPNRERKMPLTFSTGTSNKEDEEMLSVSDSYDPSRVERV